MTEPTSSESDAFPCPHCLVPLSFDAEAAEEERDAEEGDLVLDLPAGWECHNEECPSHDSGYHPDEGAKQRVLMLLQATEDQTPGPMHMG